MSRNGLRFLVAGLGLWLIACGASQAEDLWLGSPRGYEGQLEHGVCGCESCCSSSLYYTPGLIGDFFGGSSTALRGAVNIDRLVAIPANLAVPNPLPPGNTILSVTAGPAAVPVFSSVVPSAQVLQFILRAGDPVPPFNLEGFINDNRTITSTATIAQIQSLLAATPEAFDIIPVAAPPAQYAADMNSIFAARNPSFSGTAEFDADSSGAFLQGGADTLTPGALMDALYYYNYVVAIDVTTLAAGTGGVGRSKIGEVGTSPLPRNRLYFDYGNFTSVPYSNSGLDVNRYTFGFEKTFFDGLCSIEGRFPFASGVSTDVTTTGVGSSNGSNTEFGSISMYLKTLLWEGCNYAFSGGLGFVFPSSENIVVELPGGTPLMEIESKAVNVQPFLGFVSAHNRFFAQGFAQWDLATNGNPVSLNSTGFGLTPAGDLNDANHMFVDLGVGYWLYRNDAHCPCVLAGVAPILELHYTGQMSSGDVVSAGALRVGKFDDNELNMVNYVAGLNFAFGGGGNLSLGYTAPITDSEDRQFEEGFRVIYGYNYW